MRTEKTADDRYIYPRTSNIHICKYRNIIIKFLKVKYEIKIEQEIRICKNSKAYLKTIQIEPLNVRNVNVEIKNSVDILTTELMPLKRE